MVTGAIPASPRFSSSICIGHRFAIPLLVDISSSVANSRSRAFRKSICGQEKVLTTLYEYALGGARTHETDLSKLEDNLIRHRGDRPSTVILIPSLPKY